MNINDIARLSGVSSATVSRIINKVGYVKEETRERVLETMRSVGYVPSNIARSLSKRETPFIGVIVPDITNPFFSELVKSIEKVADKSGFNILFFDTDENTEREHAVLRTIKEHWIRGLLITPISWEDEVTERELLSLENSGIPVVLMDRNLHRNRFSVMMVDNFQGGYDATKALLDLGHRKIAIVAGPWQDGPGDGRIKGYLQAMRDYGVAPRPEYQVGSDFRMESSHRVCQKLMEQADPPTAILSCGNTITFGCMQYFREHSLRIGEDIALIGFDDVYMNRLLEGALSTVGCSLEKLGEEAFCLMAQRFKEEPGHDLPPEQRIMHAEVKLRGSELQKSIPRGCTKGEKNPMGQKICVMGSYITDLTARTPHLPAPGETVLGSRFTIGPGGKGSNQAVAAKRAGGNVVFVTKLGADPFGTLAVDFLKQEGIYSPTVFTDGTCATGTALIAVDDGNENNIVVVPGACAQLTAQEIGQCEALMRECAFLLVQLETNLDATAQMMELAKQAGAQVVLNPAPAQSLSGEFLAQVDIITPNESEAEFLTGQQVSGLEDCRRAAQSFFRQGVKKVVITLGSKGAFCTDGTREALLPPYPAKAVDTTGAGDAFNGGLVKALADGKDFFEAAAYACVVAGLSVQKFGTAPSMPTEEEIAAGLELYRQVSGEK